MLEVPSALGQSEPHLTELLAHMGWSSPCTAHDKEDDAVSFAFEGSNLMGRVTVVGMQAFRRTDFQLYDALVG